jgi:shikimate kinase
MGNKVDQGRDFALSKSIVLVGLMGAGKSSIGKKLAEELGLPFYDSDELVEKQANCSVADIYAYWGEKAFRSCEKEVVERLLLYEPIHVLATGDGAFLFNKDIILNNSLSIWIDAKLELLHSRIIHRSTRPQLLDGEAPLEILERLYHDRKEVYSQAHIVVPSFDEPYKLTVSRIMNTMDNYLHGVPMLKSTNNEEPAVTCDITEKQPNDLAAVEQVAFSEESVKSEAETEIVPNAYEIETAK